MTDILSQLSDAVGNIASLPVVQAAVKLVTAYVVILWLSAAFWAFRDMRRRTRDVIAPYASAGLVIAFTPFLFPAAFLVHLVLRPPETLEERSENELRLSILEADAAGTNCPTCSAAVGEGWMLCPVCGTRLRRRCPACERPVELTWNLCAWCGRDFRSEPPSTEAGAPTPTPEAPRRSAPAVGAVGLVGGAASLAQRAGVGRAADSASRRRRAPAAGTTPSLTPPPSAIWTPSGR